MGGVRAYAAALKRCKGKVCVAPEPDTQGSRQVVVEKSKAEEKPPTDDAPLFPDEASEADAPLFPDEASEADKSAAKSKGADDDELFKDG